MTHPLHPAREPEARTPDAVEEKVPHVVALLAAVPQEAGPEGLVTRAVQGRVEPLVHDAEPTLEGVELEEAGAAVVGTAAVIGAGEDAEVVDVGGFVAGAAPFGAGEEAVIAEGRAVQVLVGGGEVREQDDVNEDEDHFCVFVVCCREEILFPCGVNFC